MANDRGLRSVIRKLSRARLLSMLLLLGSLALVSAVVFSDFGNQVAIPATPASNGSGSAQSKVLDITSEATESILSVETVLEKGLNELDLSPVHLGFRGTAIAGSVRCQWRGIIRTMEQRERAIRFWLGLDEEDPLPAPTEVETAFLQILDAVDPAYPETAISNFRDLARGGLSTDYVFLSCFADFSAAEYILGAGPSSLTVAYDNLAEARSYDLYRRAYDSGELVTSSTLPLPEGEYRSELAETVSDAELSLRQIVEGRESVVFLAPMGAHNAIAFEAWQAVAQWDLQTDEDDVVHAVRYGASPGDPEHVQTLANLESRITAATTGDASTGARIANVSGLTP